VLPLLAAFALPLSSSATTLQLKSVNARTGAQFVIDGERRDARQGSSPTKGCCSKRCVTTAPSSSSTASLTRCVVGEIAVVDSQTQGLITHQIKADQKNKYMTPVLLNGGNVLGEVDRAADITVIPVADADRLNLPYKDKKVQTHRTPKQTIIETKDGKEIKTVVEPKDKDGKPATYRTWVLPLNSIRIGTVDVYGVTAIVSEKPGLTNTVVGRDFLKRVAPSWSNRTLTLVRR
jgi:predicted aspartyl protease